MAPDEDRTVLGGAAPAPLAADVRAGTDLGAYRLAQLVGRGASGVVYRATRRADGATVAIKLLDALEDDGEARARFVREARVAAAVDHPAAVAVIDAGEDGGFLWLAMPFVEGTDLAALLRGGALAPARALGLLEQVAGALDAAHAAGLVHRDVKPGNVLVAGERAFISDFGLARRRTAEPALTRPGVWVGSIDHIAPEQVQGHEPDPRADIYALAAVLFHALTGEPPFPRTTPTATLLAHIGAPPPAASERNRALPAAVDEPLRAGLAKAPSQRPGSCATLVATVAAALRSSA